MYSTLCLVLILPFLASASHEDHDHGSALLGGVLHEGPCHEPPSAQENFKAEQLVGRWLGVRSNCLRADDQEHRRHCVELNIELDGENILSASNFRNSSSDNNLAHEKFVPIADQPGRYNSFLRAPDGSYGSQSWDYTIVRVQEGNFLVYACRPEGEQHRESYSSFARSLPASEEVDKQFLQLVKDNKDDREMLLLNHDDCNYKLNQPAE